MEPTDIPGGMFGGIDSGMLGLGMSLQHHIPQHSPQNHQHLQQHPHQHPVVGYDHHQADHSPLGHRQSLKQAYPYGAKAGKNPQLTPSDEDEPGLTAENSADDCKRKMSPWQRVKWTDGMVKLLIVVVYYIGDEVGSEGSDPNVKKKSGGMLQKKGKWKSVSRAMMEKGFYVSPQQCEDKFNDLNKRYKRVNDILGKGTACKVVENQSLLQTMDLPPKMKEEVKKLLNSKHLFFREMCAYHNSCAHAGAGAASGVGVAGGGSNTGGAHQSLEMAAELPQTQQLAQQHRCLHLPESVLPQPNSDGADVDGLKKFKRDGGEEDDDDNDDEDDEVGDEDADDVVEGGIGGDHRHGQDEEDDPDEKLSRKRKRETVLISPLAQQLSTELMSVVQDGTKSTWEKRKWMRARLMQLEEQRVGHQFQAIELEKQRLKWLRFSSKKEREMEEEKLTNERVMLENERMVILLRQKELELIDCQRKQQQHHSSNKRSDHSSISG